MMSKKQVMAGLLVTVGVLSAAPLAVLADEATVTSPVDVVVPSPSDTVKVPAETNQGTASGDTKGIPSPSESVTPETPVAPVIPDKQQPDKPVQPEDKPSEGSEKSEKQKEELVQSEDKPSEQSKIDEKKEEEKPVENQELPKPTEQPKSVTVTEEEIQAAPIQTNTGHTVFGTSEGRVFVQGTDGTVSLKEAAEIGAVKQTDGTVALKDDKGKLKVLPSTGTTQSVVGTLLGSMFLVAAIFLKKFKFDN